ncbi:MAG: glycosyltransferase family 2 protein [Waterburya sp.]
MINSLNVILFMGSLVLLVPCLVFCIECLAALLPRRSQPEKREINLPKTTILVPANNEAAQIYPVLETALQQLTELDQLIVIADNCSDDTAAIARNTGATVIERTNLELRGKGYALDCGLQYIQVDPPEVVVILDADCLLAPGAIDRITRLAHTTGKPVQSTYLMERPDNQGIRDNISAFALTVKNMLRLQGLNRLGCHCLLTGSGMAFPWSVIREVSLASGNIVEDMQLTIDLILAGHTTLFCPTARVTGILPSSQKAAKSQRTRWEHGHLRTILTQVPRLLKEFVRQGDFKLLIVALDILIPPLSLLIMTWLATTIIAWLAVEIGASLIPAKILTLIGCFLGATIFLIWGVFGRSILPLQNLLAIPLYILSKIPIYLKFFIQPQSKWLRTERDR